MLAVFIQHGDYSSIGFYYFPPKDNLCDQHWLAIDLFTFYQKYSRSLSLLPPPSGFSIRNSMLWIFSSPISSEYVCSRKHIVQYGHIFTPTCQFQKLSPVSGWQYSTFALPKGCILPLEAKMSHHFPIWSIKVLFSETTINVGGWHINTRELHESDNVLSGQGKNLWSFGLVYSAPYSK